MQRIIGGTFNGSPVAYVVQRRGHEDGVGESQGAGNTMKSSGIGKVWVVVRGSSEK